MAILSVSILKAGSFNYCRGILADFVRRSPLMKKPTCAKASVGEGGERGIRTPGSLTFNGFQDRRNRPLCHLSGRKIRVWGIIAKYNCCFLELFFVCQSFICIGKLHFNCRIPLLRWKIYGDLEASSSYYTEEFQKNFRRIQDESQTTKDLKRRKTIIFVEKMPLFRKTDYG